MMRELTFVDPTRLIKFNDTDCNKVQSLTVSLENGWDVKYPCVVINRADALFAINASHRIEAATELEINAPCYIIDSEELGVYDWNCISDASDLLGIMLDAGLDVDAAYIALKQHIAMEN